MNLFDIGFLNFKLLDLFDMVLFTSISYKLFLMLKDTRAITMFIGMVFIAFIAFVTDFLNFTIVSWLLDSMGPIFWVAFVILFQPELRRILLQIGQNKLVRKLLKIDPKTVTDEIVKASFELSEKRFGGLFVLQKNVGLKNVIETGTMLKSEVSKELLVSIFFPRSPLHDGAIVIVNDVLVAAQCILPISQREDIDSKYGTLRKFNFLCKTSTGKMFGRSRLLY